MKLRWNVGISTAFLAFVISAPFLRARVLYSQIGTVVPPEAFTVAPSHDWGSYADIAQAVASILNIIVVGWIFAIEVRRERRARIANNTRERICFRIRTLVLEPNIALLHDFFSQTEAQAIALTEAKRRMKEACVLRSKSSEAIVEFKDRFRRVQDQIVEPLILIAEEFSCLRHLMSKVEDLVTSQMDSVDDSASKVGGFARELRRCRTEFLRTMFAVEDRATK